MLTSTGSGRDVYGPEGVTLGVEAGIGRPPPGGEGYRSLLDALIVFPKGYEYGEHVEHLPDCCKI